MGCDIHPVIEVNDAREGESEWWDLVAVPDRTRHYGFFNYIAGVRGEGPGQFPQRGLPHHMDYQSAEMLCGDDDGHSATFWTLTEMQSAPAPKDDHGDGAFLWHRWLRIMQFYQQEYGVTADNVRVVMDFDN